MPVDFKTMPMELVELMQEMNLAFGLSEWPKELEVHPITYARVCRFLFAGFEDLEVINIIVGKNSGVYFKNVKLYFKD